MSQENPPLKIGLIMPISPIDGCSAEHWADVKTIILDTVKSITDYNFEAKLVSEADDIGVIQNRIVQNIYSSDLVICDVSGKNPNVMFELGMRLAFDKPTIIVKDDVTQYSFDTQIIEHINYPRDLRFNRIVDFKSELARKITATYKKSCEDPNSSPFLKHFAQIRAASLGETVVPADELVIKMLQDIQEDIVRIKHDTNKNLHTLTIPKSIGKTSKNIRIIIKDILYSYSKANDIPISVFLNRRDLVPIVRKELQNQDIECQDDMIRYHINAIEESLVKSIG